MKQQETQARYWDKEAATFDDEPDHSLTSPVIREAWINLLKKFLPPLPATLLDVGCGTGSLSLLFDELGYTTQGVDLSPQMISLARKKAVDQGRVINFSVMNAEALETTAGKYDIIFARHLLWALSDIKTVLTNWSKLLKPGGQFIFVEGFWYTGSGISADDLINSLPENFRLIILNNLSNSPNLWGKGVFDERYIMVVSIT